MPAFVDRADVDDRPGRAPRRAGYATIERIVEQRRAVDIAAAVGKREQHAVELAAVKRLAGRLAGLLAQIQACRLGHSRRRRGSIAGSRNGAMVGMTPMRSSP